MIEKGVKYYPESRPLEGVRKHLIKTGETVLINKNFEHAAAKYGMHVVPGTEMPKSLLFVPLVLGESAKGYISLQNIDRENAFSDDDVRLLTTLANSMSVSLENARLFDETNHLLAETRERAAELAIINSVGEGLAQQLDYQAIIDLVGDKICEVFGAQVVTISMYDSKNNLIHHRYMIERGKRFKFEEPQPIEKNRLKIVKTRKPLVFRTRDEIIDFDGGKAIAGENSKSFMGVPIILGNESTGVITVQDLDRENLFGDPEVRLLMTLAANMGVALENARLFSETTQKASELATVNDISQALVSQLEFDALIRLVGEKMVETFKADIVYVALLDRKRNMIDFPYEYGDELTSMPYGEGLTSRIISTGEPLLVNRDLRRIHKEMGISTIGVPAASYLGVPISVGGENIGVISVQSTTEENRFDEDTLRLLSTIAANVGVVMQNAESYSKLNETLKNLKATQQQLVTQEKLASLGALTAGIAHEIKNPLNFVNNFAELSVELVEELQQEIKSNTTKKVVDIASDLNEIIDDLVQNAKKINEHGKRADSIVRSMLQHSRGSKGERLETDINAMLEEDLNLAYHGMRAQDSSFNITIEKNFDTALDKLPLIQQDISRVFLNMITNGFYAAHQRKLQNGNDFSPSLTVRTVNNSKYAEIYIRDNGIGISKEIKDRLFQPFFTTKPAGSGTGLGLSISYDIVVQEHGGKIEVDSQPGEYTEFIIYLPKGISMG
jgi:signal transduction histidine kinase